MKIRGNTVGTPIKPEKVVVKCQNLTEEEKAQARENIGAAAVSGQYELIEDITIGEAVTRVSRIVDPDGNAYNFEAVRVIVLTSVASSKYSLTFQAYTDSNYKNQVLFASTSEGISTAERTSIFKCYNDCGLLDYYSLVGNTSGGGTGNLQRRVTSYDNEWENIKAIAISGNNSAAEIPVGSRILIYAVRG